MEKTIVDRYLSKKDWDGVRVKDVAKKIANSAIKFGMIRIDSGRKIIFDMDDWLKLDGETGPYLQYAYARISSLVRKFGMGKYNASNLALPLEHRLLVVLSQFNSVIESACLQNRPSLLCSYLYDLAKLFSSFYAEIPIGLAASDQKMARMNLVNAIGQVIARGLLLLGIEVVEEM
jgi:arginyl-tRNA synthetase